MGRGAMLTFALRDEVWAMLRPFVTYRRLLQGPLPIGPRAVLSRPALIALVIGSFVTLTSSGGWLPTLLVGSVVAWSWVPALQAVLAALLIALAPHRQVRLSSALDLFFVGHGPWSLWLLGVTAVMMGRLPEGLAGMTAVEPLLLSALVPIGWTVIITFAFGRTVLALPSWLAVGWTLLYQAAIWGCAYLYVGAVTFRMWPFSLYGGWRP